MKIHEQDIRVLKAFLFRETQDFKYHRGGTARRRNDHINRYVTLINEQLAKYKSGDFVCVCSMTNLGQVSRELRLTGNPFKGGTNIVLYLPPSPKGGVSSHEVKVY